MWPPAGRTPFAAVRAAEQHRAGRTSENELAIPTWATSLSQTGTRAWSSRRSRCRQAGMVGWCSHGRRGPPTKKKAETIRAVRISNASATTRMNQKSARRSAFFGFDPQQPSRATCKGKGQQRHDNPHAQAPRRRWQCIGDLASSRGLPLPRLIKPSGARSAYSRARGDPGLRRISSCGQKLP